MSAEPLRHDPASSSARPRSAHPAPAVLISTGVAAAGGHRFPLSYVINRIGSAPDSDVRLTGGGVASMHASLWHDGTSWVVGEIEPAAVTAVNGVRVELARVVHGDVLTIADWTLVLVDGRQAATRTRKATVSSTALHGPHGRSPRSVNPGDVR